MEQKNNVKKIEKSNNNSNDVNTDGKNKDYILYTIIVLGFVFVSSFLFIMKSGIDERNELLQEQINYIYKKDNDIEASFKKFMNYQSELTKRLSEQSFEDLAEDLEKDPYEEKAVPFDHIKKEDIIVTQNRVIIKNNELAWAEYTDSGSMEPILSSSANGIEIRPETTSDLHVGDIISYQHDDKIIIHRIVKMGIDDDGWYVVTKGDNLLTEDPIKVRFENIQGLLVGIIY